MSLTRRRQPARRAMVLRELTNRQVLAALRTLGGRIDEAHLDNALRGRAHPNDDLRRLLPLVLGLPLEACFDAEVLALDYTGPRR